jgi:hypothetical protein
MKKLFRNTFALVALGAAASLPVSAQAETVQYSCSFTQASYTAPFQNNGNSRSCPEGRCSYLVAISGNAGTVNGVSGFTVEQSDQTITLSRTAKDPIMGGLDTTVLTINRSDMSFENVKTTTPSVVLKTQGTCQ